MPDQKVQDRAVQQSRETARSTDRPTPYLNHGVPSLVAMDNPDDSQLGAPPTEESGGKR
jgi:hypothetical protein